jgi:hypothetical protein
MSAVFKKLNLGEHTQVLILNAPDSFEPELAALRGVKVLQSLSAVTKVTFALAFVIKQAELDRVSKSLVAKADGDAVLWIAYPKGSSKRYSCEFNRDTGWGVLKGAGFDTVRMVAIDADWSAVRFRRNEFISRR